VGEGRVGGGGRVSERWFAGVGGGGKVRGGWVGKVSVGGVGGVNPG